MNNKKTNNWEEPKGAQKADNFKWKEESTSKWNKEDFSFKNTGLDLEVNKTATFLEMQWRGMHCLT